MDATYAERKEKSFQFEIGVKLLMSGDCLQTFSRTVIS